MLEALPAAPGGAVALVQDGRPILRHAWGWADTARRIPFTPATLFRICSITKQFTCAAMLDRFPDPSVLDADIRAALPQLAGPVPRAVHLAHNQSGIRDYWALAMLCGAPPERPFGPAEAAALIGGTRSLHFAPGTRYSYGNGNFRLLGDVIAARTGRPLAELLHAVTARAGMATARLVPDTEAMPDGTIGYEGSVTEGFRPAVNRIHWTGDAGLAASLDDMIAWEAHIDATRDDAGSLYRRLSAPQSFADGAPAAYGFGLGRSEMFGRIATGHGGGLRGWRSVRVHVAAARLSAIVLFNHMADPRPVAHALLAALLGTVPAAADRPPLDDTPWDGVFLEPDTGLVVRTASAAGGRVALHYSGQVPEWLDRQPDGSAASGGTRLRRAADGVWMDRAGDNQSTRLVPLDGSAHPPVEGEFHCAELQATLTCVRSGTAAYAAFSGALGPGTMEQMAPAGPDLWRLPCPRALDYAPPGDWTLHVRRGPDGAPQAIEAGCWLARHIVFDRQ